MKSINLPLSHWMTLGLKALILIGLLLVVVALVTAAQSKRRSAAIEAEFPPQGEFVDVDGTRVHMVIKGQGPDVVLIHGASGSTRDMTFDLMDRLADRYRVIVVDRSGLGYSDVTQPSYATPFSRAHASPYEQADLLATAVAQKGATNPIVVGHSFGGIVGLAWALEQDVAGFVSLAGVSNSWAGNDMGWLYRMNSSLLGGGITVPFLSAWAPKQLIDDTVEGIFRPQPAPDDYRDYVGAELVVRPRPMRANARQVQYLKPHVVQMEKRYGELTLPIEIVHGDADTIVPIDVHANVFVTQVLSANLTVLPGVGHMPHHVDPQSTIDAIDRIVSRAGLL